MVNSGQVHIHVITVIDQISAILWYLKHTFSQLHWLLEAVTGVGADIVREEIMTFDWDLLPNFLYPKTVIKFCWQNWPKTKHFPYLWHFCGWCELHSSIYNRKAIFLQSRASDHLRHEQHSMNRKKWMNQWWNYVNYRWNVKTCPSAIFCM